jgi:RNA polymerase subunit RPABC4/transcription elongation factor Spt4
MAITQCSECGGQLSTKAETCPHCGTTDGSDNSRFRTTLIRVIIVQVIALGLLLLVQLRYQP